MSTFNKQRETITFEDRVYWLIENGFFLHRACTHFSLFNFHIIIGKDGRLYGAGGDTLSEAFTEAMNNYEKRETWPPTAHLKGASNPTSYEDLNNTLKDLGIDLD